MINKNSTKRDIFSIEINVDLIKPNAIRIRNGPMLYYLEKKTKKINSIPAKDILFRKCMGITKCSHRIKNMKKKRIRENTELNEVKFNTNVDLRN